MKIGNQSNLLDQNVCLFTLYGVTFILGLLILFVIDKGEAVLFFSDHRTKTGDWLFKYGTKLGEHYIYVFSLIILLFVKFRHAIAVPLLGLLVTLVAFVGKELFRIDRPKRFFSDLGLFEDIRLVEGVIVHSGASSFPSGHSMSGFALYTFFALCLKEKGAMALFLGLIAIMVGISRVYLVQHFLEDVIAGGLIGTFLAIFWYSFHLLWGKPNGWLDRKIDVAIWSK